MNINLKFSQKLLLGFGVILTLVVLAIGLGSIQTGKMKDGYVSYRQLARLNITTREVYSNLFEARLAANKYISTPNETYLVEFNKHLKDTANILSSSADVWAVYLDLKKDIDSVVSKMDEYNDVFSTIVTLFDKRESLINDNLTPTSALLYNNLERLLVIKENSGDVAGMSLVNDMIKSMLYTRGYIVEYFLESSPEYAEKAENGLVNLESQILKLKNISFNNEELAIINSYMDSLQTYKRYFYQVQEISVARHAAIVDKLDPIGASVGKELEHLKEEITNDQNTLGPELIADMNGGQLLLTTLGTIVAVMTLLLAYFIYRIISRVVGGEPAEIQKIVQEISVGDLSKAISTTGQETGIYKNILEMRSELSRIIQGVHSISDSVSSASVELAAIMEQTEVNSQKELSQVEQIATAITELSSTASEVSQHASIAESSASNAKSNVENGQESLSSSDEVSQKVQFSIQETDQIVNQLREYSIEIGSVVEVINAISEQTNLLALNAAIEAARAGEQGRGFAVVADEVRNLAGKTQKSTVDIQEIISRLQNQAEEANKYMVANMTLVEESREISRLLGNSFAAVTESVAQISDINMHVATASEEQSNVTNDISENVSLTFELVNQNVAGIRESQKATEELSNLAVKQKDLIAFFKL